MPLDIPLPTASPEDDPGQYTPLLLSAIEGFLLATDVWEAADYNDARQYMEQLMSFIVVTMGDAQLGRPIGQISAWAIATPPAGWLICNGASILRSAYAALFAVLGTAYGAADGTHFNLPSYVDYSLMGAGNIVAIGGWAGNELHAISAAEMPVHNHGLTDPGHNHNQHIGNNVDMRAFVAGGSGTLTATGAATSSANTMVTGNKVTGATVNNAGSGTPMSLVHPVRGAHFIIYAGV